MSDTLDYIGQSLKEAGFSDASTIGIMSGIWAESKGKIDAFNSTAGGNGAYGIGQWRGTRQAALFAYAGTTKPTLAQQVSFLIGELTGKVSDGAWAGNNPQTVLGAQTSTQALTNYVNNFMRPSAAGATQDIAQGTSFMRSYNFTVNAGQSPFFNTLGPGGLGGAMEAIGNAGGQIPIIGPIASAVSGKSPIDLNSWFGRVAIGLFALVLIAAALFTFRGSRQAINTISTRAATVAA